MNRKGKCSCIFVFRSISRGCAHEKPTENDHGVPPKPLQNAPRRLKIAPRRSKTAPKHPKTAPKCLQNGSQRPPWDDVRRLPENLWKMTPNSLPKTTPGTPKHLPTDPQETSKGRRNLIKMRFKMTSESTSFFF